MWCTYVFQCVDCINHLQEGESSADESSNNGDASVDESSWWCFRHNLLDNVNKTFDLLWQLVCTIQRQISMIKYWQEVPPPHSVLVLIPDPAVHPSRPFCWLLEQEPSRLNFRCCLDSRYYVWLMLLASKAAKQCWLPWQLYLGQLRVYSRCLDNFGLWRQVGCHLGHPWEGNESEKPLSGEGWMETSRVWPWLLDMRSGFFLLLLLLGFFLLLSFFFLVSQA